MVVYSIIKNAVDAITTLHMRIATSKLALGFIFCFFNHLVTFPLRSFHLLRVLFYCKMEAGIPPLVELLES
jgi:hypothetical protein